MSWDYTAFEQQATRLKVGDIEPGVYTATLKDARPVKSQNGSMDLLLEWEVDKGGGKTIRKLDDLKNEEKTSFKVASFCAGFQVEYGAPGEHRSLNYQALVGKSTLVEITKSVDGQYLNFKYNPRKPASATTPSPAANDPAASVPDSDLPF